MFTNEKISLNQAAALNTAAGIGTVFLIITQPALETAGRDGWMTIISGYFIGMLIGLLLIPLAKQFPGKTLVQYLPELLGFLPGKVVALVFVLAYGVFSAMLLRQLAEVMGLLYAKTPAIIFTLGLMVLVVYVVRSGFEVFARVAEAVPIIFLSLFLLALLALPDIRWTNFLPMLENGVMPVLQGLPPMIAFAGEAVLFMAFWFPTLSQPNEAKKAVIIGFTIAGLSLTAIFLATVGVFGVAQTQTMNYPIFNLAAFVLVGHFLEEMELLLMIIWVPASLLKVTIFFYPFLVGLGQIFNFHDYKKLSVPLGVAVLIIAHLPQDLFQRIEIGNFLDLYIILPLTMSIPLLLLLSMMKKRR
ncbi:MAG: endospore germination permease [Syntrophomonadaceae bacterium]|nr:endospore germination permease [Syntrophomonadaceae bacterium]